MKITHKTFKNPRQFPYTQYTDKIGRHTFEANLFDGDGGCLTCKGTNRSTIRTDAFLEDWIRDAEASRDFYTNLAKFLNEVQQLRKK